MRKSEKAIQNEVRNALAGSCLLFRANVGTGWTGEVVRRSGGEVVLAGARPLSSGLPLGFSDLFGLVPVVVTPEMVGQTLGVFVAVEMKSETGAVREEQEAFIKAVRKNGGRAGVARSVADARAIAGLGITSENEQPAKPKNSRTKSRA